MIVDVLSFVALVALFGMLGIHKQVRAISGIVLLVLAALWLTGIISVGVATGSVAVINGNITTTTTTLSALPTPAQLIGSVGLAFAGLALMFIP